MKIYLVTAGAYSDYGIEAAFSNKEAADAVAAELDDAGVETYEVYDTAPPKVMLYTMAVDGLESEPQEFAQVVWPWSYNVAGLPKTGRPRVQVGNSFRGIKHLAVRGLDRERVIKAFHDRLAQLRAEQEGIA